MIVRNSFGVTADGRQVDIFTLRNSSETSVDIITYGATINSILVPDRDGKFADVLVGFDTVEGHEKYSDYEGMTVGRYANRLANGSFTIDGVKYEVEKNENGVTCLHGGAELSHAVWKPLIADDNCLEMSYHSPDGAMGFPGNVDFKVTFTLFEDNSLKIDYYAVSDKKTVINMTNHAYFNLAGEGDFLGHELMINADAFTPTDERSIPTGEICPVEGTAFDFRQPKLIGRDIAQDDPQLIKDRGYDHNFCIDGDGMRPCCTLMSPKTRLKMYVSTDMPGVQIYTGNFISESEGKAGTDYHHHDGIAIETQFYPDALNHPEFPSPVLKPRKEYRYTTVYQFSADE